jgi:hypothetical protein
MKTIQSNLTPANKVQSAQKQRRGISTAMSEMGQGTGPLEHLVKGQEVIDSGEESQSSLKVMEELNLTHFKFGKMKRE